MPINANVIIPATPIREILAKMNGAKPTRAKLRKLIRSPHEIQLSSPHDIQTEL